MIEIIAERLSALLNCSLTKCGHQPLTGRRRFMQKRISIVAAGLVLAACATAVVQSTKDGLVE